MEEITHRFGVPNRIVTDLGTTFTGFDFWDFCQDCLIDVYYSSVVHPRCNSLVEHANGTVLQGIKDRIFDDASQYASRWLVELPHVIWGLRTQVSSATSCSPFFLGTGQRPSSRPTLILVCPASNTMKKGQLRRRARSTSTALRKIVWLR
jgi:hypothetical protein